MQGMIIQDYSPSSKVVARAGKEMQKPEGKAPEKSFSDVLGGKEEQVVAQPQNQSTAVASPQEEETTEALDSEFVSKKDDNAEASSDAAPFFMAALIGESAAFVDPPKNADLVAVAERAQELIGAWLQPQQEGENGIEEVLTTALEVLGQAETSMLEGQDTEEVQVTLSAEEIAELKALMAVMLQSGQFPQTFADHPLAPELETQVVNVQSIIAAQTGQVQTEQVQTEQVQTEQAQTEQIAQIAGVSAAAQASSREESEPGQAETEAPAVVSGLQESQLARLLKPRQEQATLHEVHAAKGAESNTAAAETTAAVGFEILLDPAKDVLLETPEVDVLSVATNVQPHVGLAAAPANQQLTSPIDISAPKLMQLPSGQQVPESQLLDQVVTHLAGSTDGASGRMRLNLNPAELGSIRLDLIIEGDRLRAHLQAQTHQVQEVLDRNLGHLKNALQAQGLKIDEFRVDVQSDHERAGQDFAGQQPQHREQSPRGPWLDNDWKQPEIAMPLQQLVQQAGGGISLRV